MGELPKAEHMIGRFNQVRDQLDDSGKSRQLYPGLPANFNHAMGNLNGAAEL